MTWWRFIDIYSGFGASYALNLHGKRRFFHPANSRCPNLHRLINPSTFFFFHWHYSSLRILACRTMSFHFFLSATSSLHLLTPSIWISLSTSSFHLSWVFPFFSSLPVLEWRPFWPSYPPPFPLGDLTSLSFALLSILLYFLLCSFLLVPDSSDFSIPRAGIRTGRDK